MIFKKYYHKFIDIIHSYSRTQALTDSPCHYGLIDEDHWNQPSFINETYAAEQRQKLEDMHVVPYADSVPYRNMCRYGYVNYKN